MKDKLTKHMHTVSDSKPDTVLTTTVLMRITCACAVTIRRDDYKRNARQKCEKMQWICYRMNEYLMMYAET